MAQRTGADGLIASVSRAASAGAIPALAVTVALVVSGCGRGSDAPTASTADGTSSKAAASTQGPSRKPASAKSESSSSGAAVNSKPHAGAGKSAPHVAVPSGHREPAPTPEQEAHATVASISLTSPAIQPAANSTLALPTPYTCDGNDSWPALHWQGVPPGSVELALFAMSLQPVEGKLFFDWAVAGLDPSLEGLEAARLPKGAVVGENSFGKNAYSICPQAGSAETYVFALYALPKALSPKKGFDPHTLREEALRSSGNVGLLAASYANS